MLKIISVFSTSDGATFPTEDGAKAHEIGLLTNKYETDVEDSNVGAFIVLFAKEIIAILTDKPVANPRKPRKDKGTTRIKPLPEAA